MAKTLTIIGYNFHDIPSFYAEINRVFMSAEEWTLAPSLDALSDMLHGGYGAIAGREPVRLVWEGFEGSRSNLGVETTRAFLREKLQRPEQFNVELIGGQLDVLDRGVGQTYFEIVLEIIAGHSNIELVTA
jgi:RNAse (barnase) inhibitor barstar